MTREELLASIDDPPAAPDGPDGIPGFVRQAMRGSGCYVGGSPNRLTSLRR